MFIPKNARNSKRFPAIYSSSDEIYGGNPLIEALPPIMEPQDVVRRLSHFPEYRESMREKSNSVRYQYLRTCLRFFTLLGMHIDLERRFSSAIRMSYWERNPAKPDYIPQLADDIEKFKSGWQDPYNIQDDYVSTCAPGFNIVGISGCGKSQTAERILRVYPQVIVHSEYKEQEFTETQIVYLKLECPFDGSVKALCLNFFQQVDAILGTDYLKNYGANGNRSANAMLPYIATVAANHHLGILVIDEIQRLNSATSGGRKDMLNFFVQLVNTIRVAVVLIGTFQALGLLDGSFSQMRRGTGQGDYIWDRMEFDETWDSFVKSLWKYQFTRKQCSLEDYPALSKVLYEESQGITDLAIKLYMFAQERAIESGKEMLDAGIIRSAAKDKFQIIRPAIEAFRLKDKKALSKFEDAYPTFLEKYLYSAPPNAPGDALQNTLQNAPQNTPLDPSQTALVGQFTAEPEAEAMVDKSNPRREPITSPKKRRKPKPGKPVERGGAAENPDGGSMISEKPGYETLLEKGSVIAENVLGFGDSGERRGGRI